MPETAQQRYSRELNANQNARFARSNALFAQQQQARAKQLMSTWNRQPPAAHQLPIIQHSPPDNSIPAIFVLGAIFGFPLLLLALIASRIKRKRRQQPSDKGKTVAPSYRVAPSLLTPTEAHFYQTLREAVGPLAVIQCKVRLADLLIAPPHDFAAFRRVSQKHIDFVLCERCTLKPLVAVELDDRSHKRTNRIMRDKFVDAAYASANLPLIHIPVQCNYDPMEVLAKFQRFLVHS